MRWFALLLLVMLPSCTTGTIYLTNSATGQVVSCGGHPLAFPIYATIASTHDRECVRTTRNKDLCVLRRQADTS